MFNTMKLNELKKRLPAAIAAGFEGADYNMPKATLRELMATGVALDAHAPAKRTSLENEALEDVREATGYAAIVLEHNELLVSAAKVKMARHAVITETTSLKTMVKGGAGSSSTEVRETADRLLTQLFQGDMDRINTLGPRGVWNVALIFEHKLANRPDLRADLDTLVPTAMTETLIAARETLGAVAGLTEDGGEGTKLDHVATATLLRRRVTRYVAALVASAKEGDVASCQRAEKALRPILELRKEVGRRGGAKKGAEVVEPGEGEGEVVEEEAEAAPGVETEEAGDG